MTDRAVRCLLLGATGYLGAHVHTRLAAADGLELVTAGRSLATADVYADLADTDPSAAVRMLHEVAPDVVVNCTGRTQGDAAALMAGNVVTTATLVEAVRRAVPAARLVHLGSAAEYGAGDPGRPVTEATRPRPIGAYGMAKLAATRLVRAAVKGAGLDAVVLRVFNPIGPGAPGNSLPGRLVAELQRTALTGEDVHVGPLDAYRDFVDVRDVADAVYAAAIAPQGLPFLLNIGSGRATGLRELVSAMASAAGGSGRILEDAPGSARSSAVPWQCADVAAAGRSLGWAARIGFGASVQSMWAGAGHAA